MEPGREAPTTTGTDKLSEKSSVNGSNCLYLSAEKARKGAGRPAGLLRAWHPWRRPCGRTTGPESEDWYRRPRCVDHGLSTECGVLSRRMRLDLKKKKRRDR